MMTSPLRDKVNRLWLERQALCVALILLGLAYLVYANTFGAAWSHDDFPVLVDNPDIRSLANFFHDSYPGRPLREVTYLLDYQLFGLQPVGYHLQNIFWHGLNAILLWHLALRLGAGRVVAWLASLLFLVHPLQVEVVANISHRKDSLALAFVLLALLAYLRGRHAGRWEWSWLVAAAACWGVALTAKQNVVVLPVIIVGYELLFADGWRNFGLRGRLGLAGLGAVSLVAGVYIARQIIGSQELSATMAGMLATKAGLSGTASVPVFYATVLKSWLFNWGHLVWPRNLAIEYFLPAAQSFGDVSVLLALLLVSLLLLAMGLAWRRLPLVSFGIGWFLLFWLPTSNLLPQAYFAADRYMYAPSAGALLAIAVVLDRLVANRRVLLSVGGGGVLLLSVLTWQQNEVWRTEESLWENAVTVSPQSSFALNNLGNIYLLKNELLKAIPLYERACQVDPLNPTAFYNLGMIHERAGNLSAALPYYRRFLDLDSPFFRTEAAELRRRLVPWLNPPAQP